jgi:hypothetical protein
MGESISLEAIQEIKKRHEHEFMSKKNVVGLGIGFKERGGTATEELSLVVFVSQKLADNALDLEDRLPESVEGVPVDVQEVGKIRAF